MVLQQCLACNLLVSETSFGQSRSDFELLSMMNTEFVALTCHFAELKVHPRQFCFAGHNRM